MGTGNKSKDMLYDVFDSTWALFPQNLYVEEINNPLTVIEDFFAYDSLPNHLKNLKIWRDFVLKDEAYYNEDRDSGELIFFYRFNLKMIEAANLLAQQKKSLMNPDLSADEQKRLIMSLEADGRPKLHLEREERLDPYLVLVNVFQQVNLPEYRAYFFEWLENGLSKEAAGENTSPQEIVLIYGNLQRLYEATWIIYMLEICRPAKEIKNTVPGAAAKAVETQVTTPVMTSQPFLSERLYPSPEQVEKLSKLTTIIVQKMLNTRMIVYVGSRVGKVETFYLIIIYSNNEKRPEHELNDIIETACKATADLVAMTHNKDSAVNAIEKNNLFFCNALLNGYVAYKASSLALPVPQILNPEEYLAKSRFAYTRWCNQGAEFLDGAAYYQSISIPNIAIFLLHQAIASFLIGVIKVVTGYRLSIHNLVRLQRISQIFSDELANVFELDTEGGQKDFAALNRSFIESRYFDQYQAPQELLTTMLEKGKVLKAVTERICNNVIGEQNV